MGAVAPAVAAPGEGPRRRPPPARAPLALAASAGLHAGALAAAWLWLAAAPAPTAGGAPAIEVEMIGAEAFERMASEAGAARADDVLARLELPPPTEPVTAVHPALATQVEIAPQPEIAVTVEVPEPAVPLPPSADVALAIDGPEPAMALSAPVDRAQGLDPPRPPPVPRPASPPTPTRRAVRPEPRQAERPAPRREPASIRPAARGRGTAGTGEDAAQVTASLRGGVARTAPAGEAGPGATAAYQAQVLAHLARHKRYPDAARLLAAQGSVRVTFAIASDGAVTLAALAGSSGHPILDQEALAMVRRAAPFPRPPSGAARFTAPIRYDMR